MKTRAYFYLIVIIICIIAYFFYREDNQKQNPFKQQSELMEKSQNSTIPSKKAGS
jgi:uncharacterized protein YxeA